MPPGDRKLVYSTGPSGGGPTQGTPARGAGKAAGQRDRRQRPESCRACSHAPCRCEPGADRPPERQSLRVRFERAGRKGKTVTVAAGLVLCRETATILLADLKRSAGTGGTLKTARAGDGELCFDLELQGDHVDAVVAFLVARGFKAKRSGG